MKGGSSCPHPPSSLSHLLHLPPHRSILPCGDDDVIAVGGAGLGLVYDPAAAAVAFSEEGAVVGAVLPLRWEMLSLCAGAAAVFETHPDLRSDVASTKLVTKLAHRLLVLRGPRRSASASIARAIVSRGASGDGRGEVGWPARVGWEEGRVAQGFHHHALAPTAETMSPSFDALRSRRVYEELRARYGGGGGAAGSNSSSGTAGSRSFASAFLPYLRTDLAFLVSAQVGRGGGARPLCRHSIPLLLCPPSTLPPPLAVQPAHRRGNLHGPARAPLRAQRSRLWRRARR